MGVTPSAPCWELGHRSEQGSTDPVFWMLSFHPTPQPCDEHSVSLLQTGKQVSEATQVMGYFE